MKTEDDARRFAELVSRRRSVRGFLPTPVPESTLRELFALAQQSPSNCNTQPWLSYVVSGERRRRLSEALVAAVKNEAPSPDVPYEPQFYAGVYKERQHDSAARLYAAMGIARNDRPARAQAILQNYEFFGAPHVAFVCIAEFAGPREMADAGMYAQTLMLAMTAHGLASCPQTALGLYARPIKIELGISAEQKLLFGISFGYEDKRVDANAARMPRAALEDSTRFLD